MKKTLLLSVSLLAIGVAALGVTGCNKSGHEHSGGHAHQYTCPMKEHSDVLQDNLATAPSAA